MSEEQVLDAIAQAVVDGDRERAEDAARKALRLGIEPMRAIQDGGGKGMDEVGRRFERFELFLPDLILAAEAMKAVVQVLIPEIGTGQRPMNTLGKVVLGTVSGDIHDIGKNLVAAMLSVTGYEVYDLGVDVSTKTFLKKAAEVGANIIGLSSLLTTSAYYQEEFIKYLIDAGLRERYYVIVGGGPVTPEWAERIGADGYARTAASVPELCRKLLAGPRPPLGTPLIVGEQGA